MLKSKLLCVAVTFEEGATAGTAYKRLQLAACHLANTCPATLHPLRLLPVSIHQSQ